MKVRTRQKESGQMLIEAIVAMGILTVAVFAIFSLLARSTSLNRSVSQQYIGTYLAAEGIELVKNIVDSNLLSCNVPWNTGAVGGAGKPRTYEVDYLSSALQNPSGRKLRINDEGLYQYQSGEESLFERTVSIETITADVEIRVISTVTWRGRGGVDHEIKLEDHFFKWRPAPAGC